MLTIREAAMTLAEAMISAGHVGINQLYTHVGKWEQHLQSDSGKAEEKAIRLTAAYIRSGSVKTVNDAFRVYDDVNDQAKAARRSDSEDLHRKIRHATRRK